MPALSHGRGSRFHWGAVVGSRGARDKPGGTGAPELPAVSRIQGTEASVSPLTVVFNVGLAAVPAL